MKRPIGLYFVAVWCFYLFDRSIVGCMDTWGMPFLRNFPCMIWVNERMFFAVEHIAALTVSLWLAVGLLQMKPEARRGCLFLQSFFTVYVAYVWVDILVQDMAIATSSLAIDLTMTLIFSPLSLWYLSRRSFREFARQFVEERQKAGTPKSA